ncbi:uncharacterized protein LOC132579327 [Heteronotia binoei]|uniref:uncharacterized protein LOC132579327 n=1 Tax=Heteronotia binoei TaxID=13085 RepID=UPI00293182E7|nr:uncharacterized protein LOC132579327 [Heteronotia binoei]
MRRLTRPQGSESPLEPSLQWCVSPVLQEDLGRAARKSPDSATPSALYHSAFAQECEAVAFQLSNAAKGVPPRCPLTIQEETLTPLELPCSFLDSPAGRSPPLTVPESTSASAGPPDPFATFSCSEQSTGLAGISLGVVAQLAVAPSPALGQAGVSSGPELEKASPPPTRANVTYECDGSGNSANTTYICIGSPSTGEKETPADAASAQPAFEVCKRELPFVTSTPLMAPSLSKDASPTTSDTGCLQKRAASEQKPPADLQQESGVTFVSSQRGLPAAANSGTDRVPHVSGKAPFAKKSLSLGGPGALRTRGALGIGGLPKGTGTTRKIPQPAGRNCTQNFVIPLTRSGSAVQSQPITQKLLSDEITKTNLTELPCNKKPPISMQPPSKLAVRFGVQGSLACLGLKLHGTSRDNNASGTRLPVFTGNKVTAKTSSQKRPWKNLSEKATASPVKQPFPKRSRLCKNQKETPICSLMVVGQSPSATLEKELTAPCLQCQWLAEENQHLKSMLETCRKTIAFLEGKQSVVENENCPPQTEAT